MGSSGAIPAPVPPPEGLIPAKVAPASPMNADNHLELLQPVQALQPIPLPPPQPPPYNINPLRIYSSENQGRILEKSFNILTYIWSFFHIRILMMRYKKN